MLKLGAHVNVNSNMKDVFNHMGLNVIQVMFTNPRFYSYPSLQATVHWLKNYRKYCKEPLFVHSPYLVSLVKPKKEKQCRFTVEYARQLAVIAGRSEVPIRFVTHLGVIPENMRPVEAYKNLMENLVCIHNALKDIEGDFKVLLENDSGTRNRSKMNTAQGLYWLLGYNEVAKWFKTMWLGLCLDTNHAYGSGFDRKRWSKYVEIAEVIHFNPIPQFMELGRCQDRHHEFLLIESKEKRLLRRVAKKAEDLDVPMILENDSHTILPNLEWISQ